MTVTDGRRNNGPGRYPQAKPEERFWRHVVKNENGCWIWTASLYREGYGQFSVSSRTIRAHQWAYKHWVGPVPAGMHLDHVCHSRDLECPGGACAHRACCNPEHLEPVTPLENTRRGRGHGKETHCPQGHLYAEATTLVYRGRRYCRPCRATQFERMRPDQHGTPTGYVYGCRCDACRDAARRYEAGRRAARKAAA